MTAGDPCPLCEGGQLAAADGTWLRCPTCLRWYDNHGHAYDAATWRAVDWRHPIT